MGLWFLSNAILCLWDTSKTFSDWRLDSLEALGGLGRIELSELLVWRCFFYLVRSHLLPKHRLLVHNLLHMVFQYHQGPARKYNINPLYILVGWTGVEEGFSDTMSTLHHDNLPSTNLTYTIKKIQSLHTNGGFSSQLYESRKFASRYRWFIKRH